MPEPTKSARDVSTAAGYSASQSSGSVEGGQTIGGATGGARQTRERSSISSGSQGRSGSASTVGSQAAEVMEQTRQSLSDTYNRASHGLNETLEQAMDYGRENPGKSTLIVFGLGVGVGLLIANSFTTRSRTKRIVPPVMNALSEIASELFR